MTNGVDYAGASRAVSRDSRHDNTADNEGRDEIQARINHHVHVFSGDWRKLSKANARNIRLAAESTTSID